MILVDSNILMYAAGREHAHQNRCLAFLKRVSRGEADATIDAETLQEILHRYRALNRWPEAEALYDSSRVLFPNVLPVTGEVMDRARQLMQRWRQLSARDAVHAAVAQVYEMSALCSFDRDFDRLPGLKRIEP